MKEEKLKESESNKIILATYAMASEGLDIKTLTTLVMATPKSDVCQSVGRILRSKHEQPLVIDIIDNHTLFQNQYKKRCTYYKSKQFEIEKFESSEKYFLKEGITDSKTVKSKLKNGPKGEIKCLVKI